MRSKIWAINRNISSNLVDGKGIPDSRIGMNILADTSLSPKNGYTEQIIKWNAILPNAHHIIIRPATMPGGGSYVIPNRTIQQYNPTRSSLRGS